MENALKINGLGKYFFGSGFRLSDVSLTLPRGAVMGLIGRNGSGKTTTIKLIMGLTCQDTGTIEILGRNVGEDDAVSREKIGFVYDEQGFYDYMTVMQLGRSVAPFYRDWNHEEFTRLTERFGLIYCVKLKDLSRGQRVKLALALALSHDAELLILDEPTSGLDPVFRSELMDVLYEYIQNENKSVFFSTHIVADLEKIADYITFIDAGRVIFTGTKDDLLDRYRLVRGPGGRLDARARALCVGLRETGTGFEALSAEPDKLAALAGAGATTERATLEDIMVYTTKGVGHA